MHRTIRAGLIAGAVVLAGLPISPALAGSGGDGAPPAGSKELVKEHLITEGADGPQGRGDDDGQAMTRRKDRGSVGMHAMHHRDGRAEGPGAMMDATGHMTRVDPRAPGHMDGMMLGSNTD